MDPVKLGIALLAAFGLAVLIGGAGALVVGWWDLRKSPEVDSQLDEWDRVLDRWDEMTPEAKRQFLLGTDYAGMMIVRRDSEDEQQQ